jgi:hypothetical protein
MQFLLQGANVVGTEEIEAQTKLTYQEGCERSYVPFRKRKDRTIPITLSYLSIRKSVLLDRTFIWYDNQPIWK